MSRKAAMGTMGIGDFMIGLIPRVLLLLWMLLYGCFWIMVYVIVLYVAVMAIPFIIVFGSLLGFLLACLK